ncbi:MAG: hypothetical protein L0Y44_13560 [Phycisphaerales bacterium]|nr:hypothetical protein [Phycisphaerales bacterium]MCI0631671.1 hypothetical protein [Phycisphaerales bacterium]
MEPETVMDMLRIGVFAEFAIDVIVGLVALGIWTSCDGNAWGQACEQASCADITRTGEHTKDRFGCCVARAGLITNDAKDDLVVGALKGDGQQPNSGKAYVYKNGNASFLFAMDGQQMGDRFGHAVAGGFDANGDGRDDLIIGAPYCDSHGDRSGCVYVYSGADQALLWKRNGQQAGDRLGHSVAAAGDVNMDGLDDLVVGAPWSDHAGQTAGRIYVLSGANGSIIFSIWGAAPGDLFGFAVAGAGDVDDDGSPDIAVSAIGSDVNGPNGGHVSIFSGVDGSSLQEIDSQEWHEEFGTALAAKEFNYLGSPYTMLAATAPLHDEVGPVGVGGEDAGHVHIYVRKHDQSICDELFCQIHIANGEFPGDFLGASVAVGQCWGNSIPDVLAGAPGHDAGGDNAGAVHILSMNHVNDFCCTYILVERTITGEAAGDQFGSSVALADINDDGLDDLIVGAPFNDAGGDNAGRVYVFISQP